MQYLGNYLFLGHDIFLCILFNFAELPLLCLHYYLRHCKFGFVKMGIGLILFFSLGVFVKSHFSIVMV